MTKIETVLSIYDGEKGLLYYIAGVNGALKQQLMTNLNGTESTTGTIKTSIDPRGEMAKLNINYNLNDKRKQGAVAANGGGQQNHSNGGQPQYNNNAGQGNAPQDKVWSFSGSIFVRFAALKDNEQLKTSFKNTFGARWDREEKRWMIDAPNVTVQQVEQFLGMSGSGAVPQGANAQQPTDVNQNHTTQMQNGQSMVNEPVPYCIPRNCVTSMQNALAHLANGGVVKIAEN